MGYDINLIYIFQFVHIFSLNHNDNTYLATIGHPYICFGLFVYANVAQMIDIFNDKTCTQSSSLSQTQKDIWNTCFVIVTVILLIIVVPAGIVVSVKNHKDVKFQINWKEQNAKQREQAISNAIEENAQTFVYTGPNDNADASIVNVNHSNMPTLTENIVEQKTKEEEDQHNEENVVEEEVAFSGVNINELARNHVNINNNNHENENDNNNNIENAGNQISDGDMPVDLPRVDTEEQLRMAIAASVATAKEEEQKRGIVNGDTNEPKLGRDASGMNMKITIFWLFCGKKFVHDIHSEYVWILGKGTEYIISSIRIFI